MRFFCIGDIHIKINNIEQIDELEKGLKNVIQSSGSIDAIVILGDVLHTHERVHTLTLNRAYALFQNILAITTCPVFVLVGNHDYIKNDQFLTQNHWMNALKEWSRLFIVDNITYFDLDGEFAVFCPYVPVGRFKEALDTGSRNWRESQVIFAHQEFRGALMRNGILSFQGDEWNSDWPLIISGHIHSRQSLESGVYYTGAALPSFSAKAPIIVIYDTLTKDIQEIPIGLKQKQTIRNITVSDLETRFSSWNLNDIERIIIQDAPAELKLFKEGAIFTRLQNNGIKISFNPMNVQNKVSECTLNFVERITRSILEKNDEYAYGALEYVLNDNELDEREILIVSLL